MFKKNNLSVLMISMLIFTVILFVSCDFSYYNPFEKSTHEEQTQSSTEVVPTLNPSTPSEEPTIDPSVTPTPTTEPGGLSLD